MKLAFIRFSVAFVLGFSLFVIQPMALGTHAHAGDGSLKKSFVPKAQTIQKANAVSTCKADQQALKKIQQDALLARQKASKAALDVWAKAREAYRVAHQTAWDFYFKTMQVKQEALTKDLKTCAGKSGAEKSVCRKPFLDAFVQVKKVALDARLQALKTALNTRTTAYQVYVSAEKQIKTVYQATLQSARQEKPCLDLKK